MNKSYEQQVSATLSLSVIHGGPDPEDRPQEFLRRDPSVTGRYVLNIKV